MTATRRDESSAARGDGEVADLRPAPGPGQSGPKPDAAPKRGWIASHKLTTIAMALLVLAAIAGGVAYWLNASQYADTDDAFIDARPSAISAQVAAAITDVPVIDNELVKSGQTLVRLDERNYVAAVAQAKAQIAQAEATVTSAEAQGTAQQATINQMSEQVKQAQAALNYSREEYQRAENLLTKGAGTLQQAQQANADLLQKQAAVDAAQAALAQAQKQLAVDAAARTAGEAQRHAAEAELSQAEANLSRTVIVAPFEGHVTQLTAAKGSYATPGQTLMEIVPLHVWVTANYRETQLADMRVGDPATLCIDAYDKCFPGHVQSFQAGSGVAFSLLPAENATGNYVKVVQRVPVRLEFNKQPDLLLGPGMSVTPSVKLTSNPFAGLGL